jgi:hypothetical protein
MENLKVADGDDDALPRALLFFCHPLPFFHAVNHGPEKAGRQL